MENMAHSGLTDADENNTCGSVVPVLAELTAVPSFADHNHHTTYVLNTTDAAQNTGAHNKYDLSRVNKLIHDEHRDKHHRKASSQRGASSPQREATHHDEMGGTSSKTGKHYHISNHSKHGIHKTKVTILDAGLESKTKIHRAIDTFFNVNVLKLKASIDNKPTTVDERSTAVLKYRTPHFRAFATVEVPPLPSGAGLQVGWIQTCTEMQFINTYGKEGVTSWEFPEIISGKYAMIGDADGKQYPWYGSKHELKTFQGPTNTPQTANVHMNDNFFPQVTWYIPDGTYDKTPRLTNIHRNQKFYTFLVCKDTVRGQYHILKTIAWSMELNIEVDPAMPHGKRAKLIGPEEQTQPVVLESNEVVLEPYAMKPPNANNAQTLVWRPYNGNPKIIVPPVETTLDMEKYISATRPYFYQGVIGKS